MSIMVSSSNYALVGYDQDSKFWVAEELHKSSSQDREPAFKIFRSGKFHDRSVNVTFILEQDGGTYPNLEVPKVQLSRLSVTK